MPATRHRILDIFIQKTAVIVSIAILLFMTNAFQKAYLGPLSLGPRASLLFLPAAVITLGSLVSPVAATGGIFLGALVFNALMQPAMQTSDLVLVSLVPAAAAFIAVIVTYLASPRFREFHDVRDRFSQIDAINIFYFCCVYAVTNVVLSEILFFVTTQDPLAFPPIMVIGMMFGDISGSFLVFVTLNLTFSLYLRLR